MAEPTSSGAVAAAGAVGLTATAIIPGVDVNAVIGGFAGALLFSQWVMKKPLIQRMLGKELSLPQQVWSRLNLAWAVFFILCGLANIYIAFWLPQNIWVNFKVFGLTALTLVFTLLSGVYIYRHMPQDDNH